jgi:P27 family predicted phage terminase small subunit
MPTAKDEWWAVGPELHRINLLSSLHLTMLGMYCMAYAHWRVAEEALARMAEDDPATRGLLIKSADGTPRANPLVAIASRAAAAMLLVASEFGMTPIARSRLAAGINSQPPVGGKFAGLLAE